MELLKVEDVAELLKVNKNTIYQMKASHKIPFVKIGGSVRFIKEQIIEWVHSQENAENE